MYHGSQNQQFVGFIGMLFVILYEHICTVPCPEMVSRAPQKCMECTKRLLKAWKCTGHTKTSKKTNRQLTLGCSTIIDKHDIY